MKCSLKSSHLMIILNSFIHQYFLCPNEIISVVSASNSQRSLNPKIYTTPSRNLLQETYRNGAERFYRDIRGTPPRLHPQTILFPSVSFSLSFFFCKPAINRSNLSQRSIRTARLRSRARC